MRSSVFSCSFHPEVGKPVSSHWIQWTPPQVSGKRIECSSSLIWIHTSHYHPIFTVSSSFTTTPLVTQVQHSWQVRKNLYQPNTCWYVTHLGNLATTGHPARPNMFKFLLHTFATSNNQRFTHSRLVVPISMTFLICVRSWKCAFPIFIKVKGALNESWKLETAVRPLEFCTVIVSML